MQDMDQLISRKMMSFRIIHIAMVMGSVVYGIVILAIHNLSQLPPFIEDEGLLEQIGYMSIFFVVIMGLSAGMLRKKLLASARSAVPADEADAARYLGRYITYLIIVWMVIESISVVGVVYFLMSGKIIYPLTLVAIAVVLKIVHRPKREELEGLVGRY